MFYGALLTDVSTLICKGNITVVADAGLSSTNVSTRWPSFEVINMFAHEIICSPGKTDLYTVGITKVSCFARDSFAKSSSCDFFVEVLGLLSLYLVSVLMLNIVYV